MTVNPNNNIIAIGYNTFLLNDDVCLCLSVIKSKTKLFIYNYHEINLPKSFLLVSTSVNRLLNPDCNSPFRNLNNELGR